MRTIVRTRHTQVAADLKEYAEAKISGKILHYIPDADDAYICDIEFDDQFGPKSGQDKRVDITLTLPHKHLPLHIEESDMGFKEAVDRAVDRLDQPLEKYKQTMLVVH